MTKDLNKKKYMIRDILADFQRRNAFANEEVYQELGTRISRVFDIRKAWTYDTMGELFFENLEKAQEYTLSLDGIYTAMGVIKTANKPDCLGKLNHAVYSIITYFTDTKFQTRFANRNPENGERTKELIILPINKDILKVRARNIRNDRNKKFKDAFDMVVNLYGYSAGMGLVGIKAFRILNISFELRNILDNVERQNIEETNYHDLMSSLEDSLLDLVNYTIMLNTVIENQSLKENGLLES